MFYQFFFSEVYLYQICFLFFIYIYFYFRIFFICFLYSCTDKKILDQNNLLLEERQSFLWKSGTEIQFYFEFYMYKQNQTFPQLIYILKKFYFEELNLKSKYFIKEPRTSFVNVIVQNKCKQKGNNRWLFPTWAIFFNIFY